jgi:hypothetical protein
MLGMIFGFALNLYLWLLTGIAFTWYVVFGSAATFIVGYGASWLMPRKAQEPIQSVEGG